MIEIRSIYIHIPFCERKCLYCDFLSFDNCQWREKSYFEDLKKEILLYPQNKFSTIYIGGGTPSSVDYKYICDLILMLKKDDNSEITVEVNPNSVDYFKFLEYKKVGVNRISMGNQSFNSNMLNVLGRIHNSESAEKCFNEARRAGFNNINIDLMFALPGQNLEMLEKDLEKICRISPEHISIYSLIWEEGTGLDKKRESGQLVEVSEDTEADMYEMIIEYLGKNGYIHYEISNFAKSGYESKHNSMYWKNEEYIGVGLGASGYVNKIRYKNSSSFDEYHKFISLSEKPQIEKEEIGKKEIEIYNSILGLRLINEGTKLNEEYYRDVIKKLSDNGLIEKLENGKYRLTKRGTFIANSVFESFLI